jgi:hypothetical protein
MCRTNSVDQVGSEPVVNIALFSKSRPYHQATQRRAEAVAASIKQAAGNFRAAQLSSMEYEERE